MQMPAYVCVCVHVLSDAAAAAGILRHSLVRELRLFAAICACTHTHANIVYVYTYVHTVHTCKYVVEKLSNAWC